MFCGGFGSYGTNSFGPVGFGWMFLSLGIRFIVFAVIILFVYKLFKNYTNRPSDIVRILDEKFARGEITEEEYLKRKSILTQKN